MNKCCTTGNNVVSNIVLGVWPVSNHSHIICNIYVQTARCRRKMRKLPNDVWRIRHGILPLKPTSWNWGFSGDAGFVNRVSSKLSLKGRCEHQSQTTVWLCGPFNDRSLPQPFGFQAMQRGRSNSLQAQRRMHSFEDGSAGRCCVITCSQRIKSHRCLLG